MLFMQMAEGVDDATWLYHLQQGDYVRWFRDKIKDEELADAGGEIDGRPVFLRKRVASSSKRLSKSNILVLRDSHLQHT